MNSQVKRYRTKVRSGKVPSAEASVPVELEEGLMRATLHVCTCFAGLRALGALYTVGGVLEAFSNRHGQLLTPISRPSLSEELGMRLQMPSF